VDSVGGHVMFSYVSYSCVDN